MEDLGEEGGEGDEGREVEGESGGDWDGFGEKCEEVEAVGELESRGKSKGISKGDRIGFDPFKFRVDWYSDPEDSADELLELEVDDKSEDEVAEKQK